MVVIDFLEGGSLPRCGCNDNDISRKGCRDMVEEIRRQFREIPGLLEGKEGVKPDSATCYFRQAALENGGTSVVAVLAPILVGFARLLGLEGPYWVARDRCLMALFMANAGGAWDMQRRQ